MQLDRVWFLSSLSKTGYIVSRESVLNSVYNFARVCPYYKQGIALNCFAWWNLFVLQIYQSDDFNVNLLYCSCKKLALKQDSAHFVLCPKQGNKIEGQVFKCSVAHLYPNIGRVPPPPPGFECTHLASFSVLCLRFCIINTQVPPYSKVSLSSGIILFNFMLMCWFTGRKGYKISTGI